MKLGVLLPTFRPQLGDAIALAQQCEAAGIDGVFAYDHLFPMRDPNRGAFDPLPVLAHVATRHRTLFVGPLVARVGMTSPACMVEQFRTLEALAPGRVIAGLGTGDSWSADEIEAYGLPVLSPDARRSLVREVGTRLVGHMPVWIGGGSPATVALARSLGAEVNLWNGSPNAVALATREGPTNVAGDPHDDLHGQLDALAAAGATWAIFTHQVAIEKLSSWPGRKTL